MIVWQVFNGGVSTVAQRYSDRRLRGPLGFIPKQPTLFQERPGLATRGYDSFSESEYKQLCPSVVSVRRRFHLLQVVYRDRLW